MYSISELQNLNYEFATESRMRRKDAKLMVIEENNHSEDVFIDHAVIDDIPNYFKAGDVLVINDTGVLPSSFFAKHTHTNLPIEIRLMSIASNDFSDPSVWNAYIFGDGDWRIKTEERSLPPELQLDDLLVISDNLDARIIQIDEKFNQVVTVKFETSNNIWKELFSNGRPIQYSYLTHELEIWDQQAIFSQRPLSVESPSASFQLRWKQIFDIQAKGVIIIPITHAINLSNTGNSQIDETIPFPEKYEISVESTHELNNALTENKRIIAIGTSVTRALESNFRLTRKSFTSGIYKTDLKITTNLQRMVVTGLLTGMHLPDESHIEILRNFISDETILESYSQAIEVGYLWHEYGDLTLIL